MKALLLALVIVSACSFSLTGKSKVLQNHAKELQKSTLGQTMLKMIELHTLAGNVLDELVAGIEELIEDLNVELNQLDFDFNVRTNEHNALVVALQQDIDDAEIDINRADDALENLLKPRRSQLRARIDALMENQAANRKTLDEVNLMREQQIQEYELLVEEYNGAIEAVDEALALMATLTNAPSLLQTRRVEKALEKIQSKLRPHTEHATLIKALIVLVEQNFSDQGVVGTIVAKLNEFRNQVVDALNELTAQEAVNAQEHADRVAQLDAEYAEFQASINDVTVDLDATQNKINEMLEFISQRVADRKQYEAQLDLENELYAEETDIYQNLRNEYLRELAVAEQALAMVESVDFSNIHI